MLKEAVVHVTDWYQTLLAAAGIEIGYHRSKRLKDSNVLDTMFEDDEMSKVELDGKNLWNAIQRGEVTDDIAAESRELLLDLNSKWCEFSSCGTIRVGSWKYMRGKNMASNADKEDEGKNWQKFSICWCCECHDL